MTLRFSTNGEISFNDIIVIRMKKFSCDNTVGKLMRKLRLLGFDTEKCDESFESDRILLTKSRKRWEGYEGESFLVFSDSWREQLSELEKRYAISKEAVPFSRCAECNSLLLRASGEEVKNLVPERVYLSVSNFKICPVCKKVYWSGSHVKRIKKEFERIFGGTGESDC